MKHLGNICKIDGGVVEPVDLIIGGSPCQDLSVAGKRAGLDGKTMWTSEIEPFPIKVTKYRFGKEERGNA